ncbi:sensor domain-containing diguanylate cyclase [Cedecea neteri]|uniref:sensor domain-containing diguanylate cyclase n=1 Tax=Cedecea neteri TaxID=158822 RepID=UPI0004F653FC|nr:sensor domain-containing diguanylate cyclase [Cedecea neteri]AIR66619.1 diguanylate cyclase [Cedecea neteri]
MLQPGFPPDEERRLRSLRASRLLHSGRSERFDRLTRLARKLFDAPISLICLIDHDLLQVKSADGLNVDVIPRQVSFCSHTILQDVPLVVNNTLNDIRFSDNPLVLAEPHVRFYAGCPVKLPDGTTAGTLCVVDIRPRVFTEHQIAGLRELAAIVEDEFAMLDTVMTDELTGLFNRRGFMFLGQYAVNGANRRAEPLSVVFIDLDRFKQINDNFGHEQGDRALIAFSELMRASFRETDLIARHGGDEFVLLFNGTNEEGAFIAMQHLQGKVTDFNLQAGNPWTLAFSWGCIEYNPARHASLEDVITEADRAMYQAKYSEAERPGNGDAKP